MNKKYIAGTLALVLTLSTFAAAQDPVTKKMVQSSSDRIAQLELEAKARYAAIDKEKEAQQARLNTLLDKEIQKGENASVEQLKYLIDNGAVSNIETIAAQTTSAKIMKFFHNSQAKVMAAAFIKGDFEAFDNIAKVRTDKNTQEVNFPRGFIDNLRGDIAAKSISDINRYIETVSIETQASLLKSLLLVHDLPVNDNGLKMLSYVAREDVKRGEKSIFYLPKGDLDSWLFLEGIFNYLHFSEIVPAIQQPIVEVFAAIEKLNPGSVKEYIKDKVQNIDYKSSSKCTSLSTLIKSARMAGVDLSGVSVSTVDRVNIFDGTTSNASLVHAALNDDVYIKRILPKKGYRN
ncbi:hypothetical protein AAIR98_001052 [Elusimicrobium simillimum]|uniref:hypothetical protein n=1 Tax=Elusimicrobium simillimum TaxID=3143438 RepID=UPI003C6EE517